MTLIDPERSVNRDVLNIYESSAALSRRNILPGWISAGRLGLDPAGRAQSELHRALHRLRDRRRRVARAIRISSGWFFAAAKNRVSHETLSSVARLCASPCSGWWRAGSRQNRQADAFDLAKFGKIPVLVGGRVKPLDTVARNSLLIIHGEANSAPDEWKAAHRHANGWRIRFSTRRWPINIRFSLFKMPKCSACSAGNRATGNISVSPNSRRS